MKKNKKIKREKKTFEKCVSVILINSSQTVSIPIFSCSTLGREERKRKKKREKKRKENPPKKEKTKKVKNISFIKKIICLKKNLLAA